MQVFPLPRLTQAASLPRLRAPITTRIVDDWDTLWSLRDAWWALLADSDCNQPVVSPIWLGAWWRTFGHQGGRRLQVLLVFEIDRLIGMAPLVARRVWHRGLVPVRRLELLGSGEPEEDEVFSEYLGVLARRDHEESVAEALALAVRTRKTAPWDELVLDNLDGDSPVLAPVARRLMRDGLAVDVSCKADAPYVALPATWDEYLAGLSSAQRYLVRRSLREFDAWADGGLEIARAHTAEEAQRGLGVLMELHEERWKTSGRPGAFASAAFRQFHREVLPALVAQDAVDLLWMSVRGRPVAAVYNLVWDGKVQFYQSGRAVGLPRHLRPGIVLHLHAIRHAIEAGRREYDFLGGASLYKRKLANQTRQLLRLRATRRGSAAVRATALIDHGARWVNRLSPRSLA